MKASSAYGCFPQAERIVSVAEVTIRCLTLGKRDAIGATLTVARGVVPRSRRPLTHFKRAQTSEIPSLSQAGVWGVLLA